MKGEKTLVHGLTKNDNVYGVNPLIFSILRICTFVYNFDAFA